MMGKYRFISGVAFALSIGFLFAPIASAKSSIINFPPPLIIEGSANIKTSTLDWPVDMIEDLEYLDLSLFSPSSEPIDKDLRHMRGRSHPRYIASYTEHAKSRMRKRNITRDQVEDVVANGSGMWQRNRGTWFVTKWGSRVAVVIDNDANVVTVMEIKYA